jgi:outer membrane biosynthesis protein TonB
MTSPRHLWSGDWADESARAADELARRRGQARPESTAPAEGTGPAESPAPAPDPAPARKKPAPARAAVAPKRAARAPRVRPRLRRRRALVLAIVALGLAAAGAIAAAAGAFNESIAPASSVPRLFQPPQSWLGLKTGSSPGRPGALITQVAPGGPGDQAGLQQGDVITAVNGQAVTGPSDIAGVVDPQPIGAEVLLQIERGGQLQTVGVILAGRPNGGP